MLVEATSKGFYGDKIRKEGQKFDYKGPKCSWLIPLDGGWPKDVEAAVVEEVPKKRGRPAKAEV